MILKHSMRSLAALPCARGGVRRVLCGSSPQTVPAPSPSGSHHDLVSKWMEMGLYQNVNNTETHIQLSMEKLPIGGEDFSLVYPSDVDALIDMYIGPFVPGLGLLLPPSSSPPADQGREERDPYWSRPWPSAIALAEILLRRPELVRGQKVADLGCGLGIAGLAAALAGAKEVVLLDREPLSLQCALLSAQATGLTAQDPSAFDQRSAVASGALGPASTSGASAKPRVSARVFDWSLKVDKDLRDFDVVLACDILYEKFSVQPVANVVPELLDTSETRLILADPPTRTEQNRAGFVDLLEAAGFALEESSLETAVLDGTTREAQNDLYSMVGKGPVPQVQLMVFRRLGPLAVLNTVGVKRR